jgi:hypothetical protein
MGETTCVFCGRPIEADAERSGRPPHAAHAACADEALASDAHWEAIASASGDVERGDPRSSDTEKPQRARPGCLTLTLAVIATLAATGVFVAVLA